MPNKQAILYKDDIGFLEPGRVYYAESLRQIAPFLRELLNAREGRFQSITMSVPDCIDTIVQVYKGFHDAHRAAKAVHHRYRTQQRQYCLYLRSFVRAGQVIGGTRSDVRIPHSETVGFGPHDRAFQGFVKNQLPRSLDTVTFANTFEIYPSSLQRDPGETARISMPALRVLSHNWKDTAREVVRGARLVVLNIEEEKEGVRYELELVRSCGLAPRTIVTGRGATEFAGSSANQFAAVIDLGELWTTQSPDNAPMRRLGEAVRSLAADGFEQTNTVADLSQLECWVLDRNIELAAPLLDPEIYANTPYDLFIPSSLANNWYLLTEVFPPLVTAWAEFDDAILNGHQPGRQQVAAALNRALDVFYLAASLERYYEMAFAATHIGLGLHALNGDNDLLKMCYRNALECARWSGDAEIIGRLETAVAEFK